LYTNFDKTTSASDIYLTPGCRSFACRRRRICTFFSKPAPVRHPVSGRIRPRYNRHVFALQCCL